MLASATLEDGAEASRPSVQIGDPFAEKLLIEASLRADRRGPARGPAGPGRGGHHLRGQRVRGPRRDGRRCRPRRRPAARRRHGAVRDPDAASPRNGCSRSCTRRSSRRSQAVCSRWGLHDGGDRDARRGRRAHDPAPRRGGRADAGAARWPTTGPSTTVRAPSPPRVDALDPALTPFDGDLDRRAPHGAGRAEHRLEAMGVAAVRPDGAGQHGRRPGFRRRGDPGRRAP